MTVLLFPVKSKPLWFVLRVEDPDLFLKSARLQRLPSSASDLVSHDVSLQETSSDPFTEDCACQRDGLTVIITACLTFATGVTVALIMQIYFGDSLVRISVCVFVTMLQWWLLFPGDYEIAGVFPCLLPHMPKSAQRHIHSLSRLVFVPLLH